MLFRFSLYGFLKNQRYFEPFLMLAFIEQQLSFTMIGALIAVRSLTINLLEIPSGAVADTLGRRRIMVSAVIAYAISFLVFGFAPSWHWYILAMVLFGIGESFRTGTHKAMIFEWLRVNGRTDERTKVYGFTRSWSKFGSAVSSLIAAGFVLATGDYRSVFLFSVVPCIANAANLATYPRELDGQPDENPGLAASFARAKQALRSAVRKPSLRRLMIESMGWDGVFHAAKDYLQPVLAGLAIAATTKFISIESATDPQRKSALVIGIVYAILFLLSSYASRHAHRVTTAAGSLETASRWSWIGNLSLFCALLAASWFGLPAFACLVFVLLHVAQNLWRPILISRFDDHSDPSEGATILSIESQSQRFATMFFAPALGFAVDYFSRYKLDLVPIALLGITCCAAALLTQRRT